MMTAFSQEEIRNFVIPCHGDLAQVQALAAKNPGLIHTKYEPWNETPLGAAAHVGNRPVAEFLLSQGATLEICAAAMLGRLADVAAFIDADPRLANAKGAHGIPLINHVALSGDTALADLVLARGGGDGIAGALHPAISRGHLAMVRWLLDHGADPAATDMKERTALEAAEALEEEAIAALLRERVAGGSSHA